MSKLKSTRIICLLLACLVVCPAVFAAPETQVSILDSLSQAYADSLNAHRTQAYYDLLESDNEYLQILNNDSSFFLNQVDENGRPQYYVINSLNAAKTISTDDVWPGNTTTDLELDGFATEYSQLAIWEKDGVRTTHQEFGGRVTQMDNPLGYSDHATIIAGIMVSSGVIYDAIGMSPEAELSAYDVDNEYSEMAIAAADGLNVSNHSYGTAAGWELGEIVGSATWFWFGDPSISQTEDYKFGFYDLSSKLLDNISHFAPHYLIVRIASNDRDDIGPDPGDGHLYFDSDGNPIFSTDARDPDGGASGYDCIPPEGVAKNVLTVGAVADIPGGYTGPEDVIMEAYSSWGPTDDGRIKPDIVANGNDIFSCIATADNAYTDDNAGIIYSGTSFAAPSVAGSANLLFRHYEDTHYKETPLSSTIKGIIIHTADEAGENDGPDYKFGWGLMNTRKAAEIISADVAAERIIEDKLDNGDIAEYYIASDGSDPIKVTICWTDPAGTEPDESLDPPDPMLIFDLDLRLTLLEPVDEFMPYILDPSQPDNAATTGDNTVDNVEQVYIKNPVPGIYRITVSHKINISEQYFSLISSENIWEDYDTDDDEIYDDGDFSGWPGDNPCTGGNTENCDDNCPERYNPDQEDSNENGYGDVCEPDPDDDGIFSDGDGSGIAGDAPCTAGETENCDDNCPGISNPEQEDRDWDGVGDLCDNCPDVANIIQSDWNNNGIGDWCDDSDNDEYLDYYDNCITVSNPEQTDTDMDGIGDACDNCPNYANNDQTDSDYDGIGDACDNCPDHANNDQTDSDYDGIGDACDNCPDHANNNQTDSDYDGIGDACDDYFCYDSDGDGYGDPGYPNDCELDNCPDQRDESNLCLKTFFGESESYELSTEIYSHCAADFNGDGKIDLACYNKYPSMDHMYLSVFISGVAGFNRHDYTISFYNRTTKAFDYDNDGDVDIILDNMPYYIYVMYNEGDGTFESPESITGEFEFGVDYFSDINHDGYDDLIFTSENVINIRYSNGDMTYQESVEYSTNSGGSSIEIIDMDNDGDLDIVSAKYLISILSNQGDGTFRSAYTYDPGCEINDFVCGDVDGDGDNDIIAYCSGSQAVRSFYNSGEGVIENEMETILDYEPYHMAIIDANCDGYNDLALVYMTEANTDIRINNGDGIFDISGDPLNEFSYSDMYFSHVDHDTYKDIILMDYTKDALIVYYNILSDALDGDDDGIIANSDNCDDIYNPDQADSDGDELGDVCDNCNDVDDDGYGDLFALPGTCQPDNCPGTSNGDQVDNDNDGVGDACDFWNNPISFNLTDNEENANGISSADVSGDGYADILAAVDDGVDYYLSDGYGDFSDYFVELADAQDVVGADFDNDGDIDMAAVTNYDGPDDVPPVRIWWNDGSGIFSQLLHMGDITDLEINYENLVTVDAPDVNLDGIPDLVALEKGDDFVVVLISNGDQSFGPAVTYAVGANPHDMVVTDFNFDNAPDIVVSSGIATEISILLNDGTGQFGVAEQVNCGVIPFAIETTDINYDGDNDIIVSGFYQDNENQYVSVLSNGGIGYFVAAPVLYHIAGPYSGYTTHIDIECGDYDKDNDIDISVTGMFSGNVSVLLNDGTGKYPYKMDYGLSNEPVRMHAVDLYNSNADDLIYSGLNNLPYNPYYKINVLQNENHSFAAPELGSRNPVANDLNVALNQSISIVFDQPMDASSFDNSSFIMKGRSTGQISGTFDFSSDNSEFYFIPTDSMPFGELITYQLTTTVKSMRNVALDAPLVSQFITSVNENSGGEFDFNNSYSTGSQPIAVTLAKFDQDDYLDLVVANNSSNNISMIPGNGNGTFNVASISSFATGNYPWGIAAVDLNNDGHLDIAVPNSGSQTMSVLLNDGNGAFGTHEDFGAGSSPQGIASADFNGDNLADLVVSNFGSNSIIVYINTGQNGVNRFYIQGPYTTDWSPLGVSCADVDNDGDIDILVANYAFNSISLFRNNGFGDFSNGFERITVNANGPMRVFANDMDDNGKVDLVVINRLGNNVTVSFQDNDGNFGTAFPFAVGSNPYDATVADINGDGFLDIITANNGSDNISVLIKNGTSNKFTAFTLQDTYAAGDGPTSIYSADLQGDGIMDLAVTNGYADNVSVFLGDEAETPTDPDPSCPVLYVYDGHEYIQENPLLTACEKSGYQDIVIDYYQISHDIYEQDNRVNFQLRELEDEISTIYELELLTVDHAVDQNIACAENGEIFTYNHIIQPTAAIDNNGEDQLANILNEDGRYFESNSAGWLELTFEINDIAANQGGLVLMAPPKSICSGDEFKISATPAPDKLPIELQVELKNSDGTWSNMGDIPPRVNFSNAFILSKPASKLGEYTARLKWNSSYTADAINYFVVSPVSPEISRLAITEGKFASGKLAADNVLPSQTQPLVLEKDDIYEFNFGTDPVPDGLVRDYVIKAVGRYQPDYKVYSNLLPTTPQLYGNYPNPFNPSTIISYYLPEKATVKIEIYNILGQSVQVLVNENQTAGSHSVTWSGTDDNNRPVASGVYFYRLSTDAYVSSKKMIMMK